jgi:hypothetical protein
MSTLPVGGNGTIACTGRLGQSAALAARTPSAAEAALAMMTVRRVIMSVLPFAVIRPFTPPLSTGVRITFSLGNPGVVDDGNGRRDQSSLSCEPKRKQLGVDRAELHLPV